MDTTRCGHLDPLLQNLEDATRSDCPFCDPRVSPSIGVGPLFHLSSRSVELIQAARKAVRRARDLRAQVAQRRENTPPWVA
jgi:hypothetical protein